MTKQPNQPTNQPTSQPISQVNQVNNDKELTKVTNTANNAINPIELQKFASSTLDNETIKTKLSEGTTVYLFPKHLLAKIPELKALPNIELIKVQNNYKTKIPETIIPTVYLVNNDLIVCLADATATPTNELLVDSIYLSPKNSYAIVTDKGKSVYLQVNVGINKTAFSQLNDFNSEISKKINEGYLFTNCQEIPKQFFIEPPKIELPLSSLIMHKDYQILVLGDKKTKKLDTNLMNVKDLETGKIYENIITNSDINKYGSIGSIFQIIDKQTIITEKKEGKKIIKQPQTRYYVKWKDSDLSEVNFKL